MKKFTVLFFFAITVISVKAQNSNLIIFTDDGMRFNVFVNGQNQNLAPQTNVKIEGLPPAAYKVKVVFEDKSVTPIEKTLPLEPNQEYTFYLKPKKQKTKINALNSALNTLDEVGHNVQKDFGADESSTESRYTMRFMSQRPLTTTPPPPVPQQQVIVYQPSPQPQPVVTQQTTTVIQSTQSTQTAPPGENVNINVNINAAGTGGRVNMNANSTATSSSSVYYEETVVTQSTTTVVNEPASAPQPDHYIMPGYNGPIGCPWPMSDVDFQSAKQTIASKTFEDSKLQIAKQVFNSNCMTSAQVRDIMMLFDFEDSKLDFAKYAYGRTYDLGNYYKVNDAFQFETSIDELNQYIGTMR